MTDAPVAFYRSAPRGAEAVVPMMARTKKAFVRRRGDRSQQIRGAIQIAFAAITVAVGVQFWMWVRYYESGGQTLRVARPPGVEA